LVTRVGSVKRAGLKSLAATTSPELGRVLVGLGELVAIEGFELGVAPDAELEGVATFSCGCASSDVCPPQAAAAKTRQQVGTTDSFRNNIVFLPARIFRSSLPSTGRVRL
jgi:hypothetical protein